MFVTPQSSEAPTVGSQPGMFAGLQPRLTLVGQLVKTGAVVSTAQMVWGQVAELPQASVAFQVRVMMVLVGQTPGAVVSVNVMPGALQLSVAVAEPVKLGAVFPHSATASDGQVICGLVLSLTLMVWSQVLLLLQVLS